MLNVVVSVLFVCIPFTANSAEYIYKTLILDVPACEVTGAGIVNISPYDSLFLAGKDWDMVLDDQLFMKDCLSLSKRLNTLACKEEERIETLDTIITENSIAARVFFSKRPDDKIKRQEFERYILYSSVGLDKYAIATLVEKQTGKTIQIKGTFSDKHLKWLRLTPLKLALP